MVAKEEACRSQQQTNENNDGKSTLNKKVSIEFVKTDFFETNDSLTWSLYVKDMDPTNSSVDFADTQATIKFRTSDAKFLKLHNTDDMNTQFELNVEWSDRVEANACKYKINKSTMEIKLRKHNSLKKWTTPIKRTTTTATLDTQQSMNVSPTPTTIPKTSLTLPTHPNTYNHNSCTNTSASSTSSSLASETSSCYAKSNDAMSRSRSYKTSSASSSSSSSSSSPPPSSSSSSTSESANQQQRQFTYNKEHETSKHMALASQKASNSIAPQTSTATSSKASTTATATNSTTVKESQPKEKIPPKVYSQFYGYTGLVNLGNTCYMNAALQCLINTTDLRDYFLETPQLFQKEINTQNKLGLDGKMAVIFAMFMRQIWNSNTPSIAPSKLRDLLCIKYQHFRGYEQQDTQEFLCSLLSVLHEDLNRVLTKPFYESPLECEDDTLANTLNIANQSWLRFLSRENSVIVDNFYGQFKSKLTCPECGRISITFEPFNSLLVPLPKPKRNLECIVVLGSHINNRNQSKPIRMKLGAGENDTIQDLINQLVLKFNGDYKLEPETLKVFLLDMTVPDYASNMNCEEFGYNFTNTGSIPFSNPIPEINQQQMLLIHEVETSNEPQIELYVEQICKYPLKSSPKDHERCSYCSKESESDLDGTKIVELSRCTRCYRSSYCNRQCQVNDWPTHKSICSNKMDTVGLPFIMTLTKSQLFGQGDVDTQTLLKSSLSNRSVCSLEFIDMNGKDLTNRFWVEIAQNETGSTYQQVSFEQLADLFKKRLEHETSLKRRTFKLLVKWNNQIREPGNESSVYTTTWTNLSRLEQYPSMDYQHAASRGVESSSCVNLDDCLKSFTKPEQLNKDNPWYCSKCKKHQEATKEMQVWRLPKHLIITLKRFQTSKAKMNEDDTLSRLMMLNSRLSYLVQNRVVYNKLNTLIKFPLRGLDMSTYLNKGNNSGGQHVYDLYGVINHIGQSLYSGHYTSFARTPKSNSTADELGWRYFDDAHVTRIRNENDVINKEAYVLFYRLRTTQDECQDEQPIDIDIDIDDTTMNDQSNQSSSPINQNQVHLPKITNTYEHESTSLGRGGDHDYDNEIIGDDDEDDIEVNIDVNENRDEELFDEDLFEQPDDEKSRQKDDDYDEIDDAERYRDRHRNSDGENDDEDDSEYYDTKSSSESEEINYDVYDNIRPLGTNEHQNDAVKFNSNSDKSAMSGVDTDFTNLNEVD